MIVVDTSVWVDVLNESPAPQAQRCVELIEAGEPVALTDVVLTEILQGLRSEREARLVERHLRAFPILRLEDVEDFVLAADLYRTARRAGVAIRKTPSTVSLPLPASARARRCSTPTRTSSAWPRVPRSGSGRAELSANARSRSRSPRAPRRA